MMTVLLVILASVVLCVNGDRGELIGHSVASRVVPSPKPRIPTLVYYPYSSQSQLWQVYEEEIGFNNDRNEISSFQDIPDNFYYKINCVSQPISNPWIPDAMIAQTISSTTCKSLLSTKIIKIKTYQQNPYTFSVNLIPVPQIMDWGGYKRAFIPGQPVSRISDCCDATVCTDRCLEQPQAQRCYIEVLIPETLRRAVAWGPMTETYSFDLRTVFRIPCDYCPLVDCVRQCSNGEFATGYSDYQVIMVFFSWRGGVVENLMLVWDWQEGLQVTRVVCKPCAPGTWNTCQQKPECKWSIPTDKNDAATGGDIQPIKGGPVGACFPCTALDTCLSCRANYVNTSLEAQVGLTATWSCPGGKSPPTECISRNFKQSADGSQCVCKAGMYPVGTDCVLCPAGYMCPDGLAVQCPLHYYQTAQGATSCSKCSTTGNANGFYRCVQRGRMLKFCDPAVAGTQDKDLELNCVPCNQCQRAFTGDTAADLHECYRDN